MISMFGAECIIQVEKIVSSFLLAYRKSKSKQGHIEQTQQRQSVPVFFSFYLYFSLSAVRSLSGDFHINI